MKKVRVVGIQIICDGTKKEMLEKAERYIDEAMKNHSSLDIIALPEIFYQSPTNPVRGEPLGVDEEGAFVEFFQRKAKEHKVNIITGSYLIRDKEKKRSHNKVLVINRDGQVIGDYCKIHLFDSFGMRESDYMERGDHLGIFDLDCGRIGVIVCYDIRFPELTRKLATEGMDILFVPAAFYMPRADQWEVLIKSTAINSVSYVCAINQFGKTEKNWIGFFGRSMVADPYGCVVAGASDKETYFFAEVDLAYLKEMRKTNPCLSHRRKEFY